MNSALLLMCILLLYIPLHYKAYYNLCTIKEYLITGTHWKLLQTVLGLQSTGLTEQFQCFDIAGISWIICICLLYAFLLLTEHPGFFPLLFQWLNAVLVWGNKSYNCEHSTIEILKVWITIEAAHQKIKPLQLPVLVWGYYYCVREVQDSAIYTSISPFSWGYHCRN